MAWKRKLWKRAPALMLLLLCTKRTYFQLDPINGSTGTESGADRGARFPEKGMVRHVHTTPRVVHSTFKPTSSSEV
ncbi:Uncharacterized protein TCM_017381 [Theobroma cacao]|uniref:Secreted protein n=1 Tax=Theobroma cacao TaxID=3641 RepID=A0A061EF02_THECC|nr:Uncharacterized protein TCM_017381 [Theobroma cacao]